MRNSILNKLLVLFLTVFAGWISFEITTQYWGCRSFFCFPISPIFEVVYGIALFAVPTFLILWGANRFVRNARWKIGVYGIVTLLLLFTQAYMWYRVYSSEKQNNLDDAYAAEMYRQMQGVTAIDQCDSVGKVRRYTTLFGKRYVGEYEYWNQCIKKFVKDRTTYEACLKLRPEVLTEPDGACAEAWIAIKLKSANNLADCEHLLDDIKYDPSYTNSLGRAHQDNCINKFQAR